jgi:hypothetical protein
VTGGQQRVMTVLRAIASLAWRTRHAAKTGLMASMTTTSSD